MISLIIFGIGVVVTYISSYLTLGKSVGFGHITWICAVAILGMMAINGIAAIVCSKLLPNKCFEGNKKFYTASKKECKFYEKLGVKKWKDRTIELGALNGFRKNKLNDPNNPEYIKRFILENNKGYLTHFVSIIASALAVFIMPIKFWLPTALPIAITSIIINIMPLIILKYNMPRLQTLLKFATRHEKENSPS